MDFEGTCVMNSDSIDIDTFKGGKVWRHPLVMKEVKMLLPSPA